MPLPAGVTVTRVTFYVRDDGLDDVFLFVSPVTPAAGVVDYSHQKVTTGASPAIQAVNAPTAQVGAGQLLSLLVLLPNGSDYRLYGAKVDYS